MGLDATASEDGSVAAPAAETEAAEGVPLEAVAAGYALVRTFAAHPEVVDPKAMKGATMASWLQVRMRDGAKMASGQLFGAGRSAYPPR